MSTGLGLSREGQNSGREGEHKVSLCTGLLKELQNLAPHRLIPAPPNTLLLSSRQPLSLSFPRTLCDNLRRERDRAVSDLADALRNLDDMRKRKNDALRELKELK